MKVRFQREERNFIKMINYDFEGKENAITAEHLKNGEICKVVGYGQSMTPILKSGQPGNCGRNIIMNRRRIFNYGKSLCG